MNYFKASFISLLSIFLASCDFQNPNEDINDEQSPTEFYQIAEECLNESIWDSGIVSKDEDYMLFKQDGDRKVCVYKGCKSEHSLLAIFDDNEELLEISYDDIHATIHHQDNKVYATIYHNGETSVISADYNADFKSHTLPITKSAEGDALLSLAKIGFGLTTPGGIVNLVVDAANGKDISGDLVAFGVGQFVGATTVLGGIYVGLAYEMYKSHQEYLKEMNLLYFGDAKISISNVIKEDGDSWSLTIDIKDLPNMMSTFGGIKAGVLVSLDKEKLAHPKGHGNDAFTQNDKGCWIIDERNIDDNFPNTDFNISVDIDNNDQKQYYARPYMLTYTTNGWVDIESDFIRYGEIVPLSDRWVDLGLPSGILWAAYNVGATSPEEYGGYYAWGETKEKSSYTFMNYEHGYFGGYDSEGYAIISYNDIGGNISNTIYDAAKANWDEEDNDRKSARMPTFKEMEELTEYCKFENKILNGTLTAKVTGPNGNSIYIPFASGKSDGFNGEGEGVDDGAFIWSSEEMADNPGYAYFLGYRDGYVDLYGICPREFGISVRAVKDKEED